MEIAAIVICGLAVIFGIISIVRQKKREKEQ